MKIAGIIANIIRFTLDMLIIYKKTRELYRSRLYHCCPERRFCTAGSTCPVFKHLRTRMALLGGADLVSRTAVNPCLRKC